MRRILLDTHVFIWAVQDSAKLSRAARELIREAAEVFVSAASIWEITLKRGLRKIEGDPTAFASAIADSGFRPLNIEPRHVVRVASLPLHHRDPFDRLLVAQAIVEPLHLITADEMLAPYSDLVTVI